MGITVNIARLRANLEELGRIGRDPRGGITRPSFSPADLEARAWLKDKIDAAGLDYRMDGAGNIFGRLGAGDAPVMAGSHIDTVPNGGAFDGAAGVLAALEAVQRIKEEGWRLSKPLVVAAFTDEEGALVGDFLGSRAFTGTLNKNLLEPGMTSFGLPLAEVLRGAGLSIEGLLGAAAAATAVPKPAAFLELHIEQGPVLDEEGIPVGLVDVIAGKQYRWCTFAGQAGHAGTVPIELRRDAFLGLADFALRATQYVATHHYGSFVTVGKAHVHPGVFSIIPGRADFSFDFRSRSPETMAALEKELFDLAGEVAAARGLTFASRIVDATSPLVVPEKMRSLLQSACEARGTRYMTLASGAGHDAQILGALCPSAMIFVPSPDGISHAPEESVRWEDLEMGANILLDALVALAG
jgi:N-carbamoyl-L-amino-acid hydrolase